MSDDEYMEESSDEDDYLDDDNYYEYVSKRKREDEYHNNKRRKIDILSYFIEDEDDLFLDNLSRKDFKKVKPIYEKLNKCIDDRTVNELDIINSNLPFSMKIEALEDLRVLKKGEPNTSEWLFLKRKLNNRIGNYSKMSKDDIKMINEYHSKGSNNLLTRIIKSDIPNDIKKVIYSRYKEIGKTDSDYSKGVKWINIALSIPYKNKDITINEESIFSAIDNMNKELYGQVRAKEKIVEILSTMITNPNTKKKMAGFVGSPGVGKTAFARCLSKSLNLPFYQISLGGTKDSAFLRGHGFTYIGSEPGEIVKGLISMGSKRGIMFFDELDKIQNTTNGQEVVSTLLHILDFTQNTDFKDEYLSDIPIDLSQLFIILAINDVSKIDSVLRDRLELIPFHNYSIDDKLNIGHDYMIPKIIKNIGLKDVKYTKEIVRYIIKKSKVKEKGVRQLERNLYNILTRINTLKLFKDKRSQLSYGKFTPSKNFKITKEVVNTLFIEYNTTANDTPPMMYF